MYFDDYASLSSFYTPIMPVQGRVTRQVTRQEMHIPRVKSLHGRKAFLFTGPFSWNQLPLEVRRIRNFNSFKNHIMKEYKVLFINHPT